MNLRLLALYTLISNTSAGGYNTRIAGYSPGTDVIDQGNVEQDQAAMEVNLGLMTEEGFAASKGIYEGGGNSRVIAKIILLEELTATIPKGTILSGTGGDGKVLTAATTGLNRSGSTVIKVTYSGGTCQDYNVDKSRCFAGSGTLTDGTENYVYDSISISAGRTLQGFSSTAGDKMADEEHFRMFEKYYGVPDYADQLIQAAFEGGATSFPKKGNADFSGMDFEGKEQIIKKMSAYMNVYMYVLHEFETALVKCESAAPYDAESPIHAWDEGVAFYVGYLPGIGGMEEKGGKLVHALAETCGSDFGTTKTGERSIVNIELTKEFNAGREALNMADCKGAKRNLKTIKSLMYIPLIQGTLKYAYQTELDNTDKKAVAKGIAFMHAVVPRVNDVDKQKAKTIYNNMNTHAVSCSVAEVKEAFESVYSKLSITCAQVGGFKNLDTGEYYEGMSPCSDCDQEAKNDRCASIVNDADLREKKCKRGRTLRDCPSICSGECSVQEVLIPSDLGMGKVLAKLSENGINITLPLLGLEGAVTSLTYYNEGFSYDKTCPSDILESFGQSEAENMITDFYPNSPWDCMNSPNSRVATEEAYEVFGKERNSLTADHPVALPVECILQETVKILDVSWSDVNLTSLGLFEEMITYSNDKGLWALDAPVSSVQDAYYTEFEHILLNLLDRQEMGLVDESYTISVLLKMWVIYSPLFQTSPELVLLIMHTSIVWAVDIEDAYNPIKDNVLAGRTLMEWTESCMEFEQNNPLIQIANGGLLHRFMALFTLWNSRYIEWFRTFIDPSGAVCLQTTGSKDAYIFTSHAKASFGGVSQSLALSSLSLEEFNHFRILSVLSLSTASSDCNGVISFFPSDDYELF